jgi:type III secretory pathway component EscS
MSGLLVKLTSLVGIMREIFTDLGGLQDLSLPVTTMVLTVVVLTTMVLTVVNHLLLQTQAQLGAQHGVKVQHGVGVHIRVVLLPPI